MLSQEKKRSRSIVKKPRNKSVKQQKIYETPTLRGRNNKQVTENSSTALKRNKRKVGSSSSSTHSAELWFMPFDSKLFLGNIEEGAQKGLRFWLKMQNTIVLSNERILLRNILQMENMSSISRAVRARWCRSFVGHEDECSKQITDYQRSTSSSEYRRTDPCCAARLEMGCGYRYRNVAVSEYRADWRANLIIDWRKNLHSIHHQVMFGCSTTISGLYLTSLWQWTWSHLRNIGLCRCFGNWITAVKIGPVDSRVDSGDSWKGWSIAVNYLG